MKSSPLPTLGTAQTRYSGARARADNNGRTAVYSRRSDGGGGKDRWEGTSGRKNKKLEIKKQWYVPSVRQRVRDASLLSLPSARAQTLINPSCTSRLLIIHHCRPCHITRPWPGDFNFIFFQFEPISSQLRARATSYCIFIRFFPSFNRVDPRTGAFSHRSAVELYGNSQTSRNETVSGPIELFPLLPSYVWDKTYRVMSPHSLSSSTLVSCPY